MLRMLLALPGILASAAMAFSELPDSSRREMGLDSLARKVDSLEAGLTRLRFDLQDRSPYVNGAALKWGRGLGVGMRLHKWGPDFNLSYTFKNGMEPKPNPGLFGYTRWKIVAGARAVADQDVPRINSYTPATETMAGFVGWRMSSPILLNFTSLEFGHDLYWSNSRLSWQPGWSQTLELQFWLSKVGHISLGTVSNIEQRQKGNQVLDFNRPYMGFTFSLFQPRDKSGATVK